MSALLAAEPGQVRAAAAALEETADEAALLVRQLHRAEPPCWSAPSHRDYTGQLTALGGRVDRIARSHDDAATALAAYARALDEAQDQARHARSLAEQGRRQSDQWRAQRAVGPDAGEVLVRAAEQLLVDAEQRERSAATLAAARLHELADRAPHQGWTSRTLRFVEDAVDTAVDGVTSAPASVLSLADTAWSLVPRVHGAAEQRAARRTLVETAQVWQAWLDAFRDAREGRPGLAVGVLGGGLLTPLSRAARPRRVKSTKDPFLNGVEEGVLTVDDLDAAWEQAHAARPLQERILALRRVPLPGVEALLAGPVDLAHHEAHGGHTIQRHVAVRLETLGVRLDLEAAEQPTATRSSFPDLDTAEELVRRVLVARADRVRGLLASPIAGRRVLRLPVEPVGTVLHQDGTIVSGREVVVVLVKQDGELRIQTAYLEPGPEDR